MGKNKTLLVSQRSTVRALLEKIRSNSLAHPAGLAGGIPEFYEEACFAINKIRTKARPLSAMPMAWSRWTSGALPPAAEMNALCELAERRGWLSRINVKQRKLIADLSDACDSAATASHSFERRAKVAISDRRSLLFLELEAEWHKRWSQKLRKIAESLALSLEEELVGLDVRSLSGSNIQAAHFASASAIPPHLYGAHAFEFLVHHFVRQLHDELDDRQSPAIGSSFIQPHAGWPEALRRLADDLWNDLNEFACRIDSMEHDDLSGGRPTSGIRSRLFPT